MKRPFQILVLGTGSHAGKSLLAAGLCRLLSNRGLRVAPFKAQNMALNSAVADDGKEIGRAQWLQAVAARVRSDARMNPVLLKPVSGQGSQLIVMGQSQGVHSTRAYFKRWPTVATVARAAWASLAQDHDALVLEGAGSPAEVNLSHRDLANLETARFSRAPFVLVVDIERGGSFASIVGTLGLLPAWLRPRCQGVIFNKFRGDSSLLDSGLAWLKRRGIRTLGVLPWCEGLILEEEDSLALPLRSKLGRNGKSLIVDVIRHRFIANFNDLLPLQGLPGLTLRWVEAGQERSQADLVILPGSKDSLADMRQLRLSGETRRLERWRRQGSHFLGICGGLQMLGEEILDPLGVDGGRPKGRELGLALLPLKTRMARQKTLAQTRWKGRCSLGSLTLQGYEIHHGLSALGTGAKVEASGADGQAFLLSGGRGHIWGTYLHGILDEPSFRDALLHRVARRRGKTWRSQASSLNARREDSLQRWARHLEAHLDLRFLDAAGVQP